MARFEIKMPKLGESITEGTILSWSVQVGDVVNEDDVLFEVNTAKVSAEIPSPVAGKVVEILFKEGDTVPVGTVVAIVDMDGEGSGEASETAGSVETASAPKAAEVSGTASVPKVQAEVAAPKVERWYSPAVLQLAREAKISQEELDSIPGTGYEGRLSKKISALTSRRRKVLRQPTSLLRWFRRFRQIIRALLLFLLQKYKRRLPLRLLRLSMDNLLLPFLQMHR